MSSVIATQSRVYSHINGPHNKEYWDYENATIKWG